MSRFGDKQKKKKKDLEYLRKYAVKNKNIKVKKVKKTRATIDNPKHIQQARQVALTNPLGSIVEGVRVIGSSISKKIKKG